MYGLGVVIGFECGCGGDVGCGCGKTAVNPLTPMVAVGDWLSTFALFAAFSSLVASATAVVGIATSVWVPWHSQLH